MKLFLYFCLASFITFACSRKITTETSPAGATPAVEATTVDSSDTALKPSAIPECIQKKIDSIQLQPVWNPPAEVHLYEYENRKVYLFSANCCDQFSAAYDSSCNYVCAPSGGFTGKGDRKCTDFDANAKHISMVWKDARTKQ